MNNSNIIVGILVGSKSDLPTMVGCTEMLDLLRIPFELKVLSAHRTPDAIFDYAATAESRGLEVIIAAAGGAAHLAGIVAAKTILPVLAVPIESKCMNGLDSLLSTVQMPAGVPVATLAIGAAGAVNAALLAATILGSKYPELREAVRHFRANQTQEVLANQDFR